MKQLIVYFFKNKVEKNTQKTFQVPSYQLQYLKGIKEVFNKNTFLHYTIRKDLTKWRTKSFTLILFVVQWYLYHS